MPRVSAATAAVATMVGELAAGERVVEDATRLREARLGTIVAAGAFATSREAYWFAAAFSSLLI